MKDFKAKEKIEDEREEILNFRSTVKELKEETKEQKPQNKSETISKKQKERHLKATIETRAIEDARIREKQKLIGRIKI